MLTIRLRRTGGKKDPHFRVVVADSRTNRDGPFIEVLGHYHPRRDPAEFTIDREATDAWIDKGAQPSDTVRTLIRQLDAGKVREPEPPGRPAGSKDRTEAAAEEATAGAGGDDEEPGKGPEAAKEKSEKKAAKKAEEEAADAEAEERDEEEDDGDEESGSDEEE